MKRTLLLMMAIAMAAMSASATKIYVCGTKITGSTSFSAGGGTVSYDDNTCTLTITNVSYTKTGSSNNGISVDEVSGILTINLNGTVKFDIQDADAVLCKSKGHATYINVSGNSTFTCRSENHAALKLQDCNVFVEGAGSLTVEHRSDYGRAIKGGAGTENLSFKIKKCEIRSPKYRIYNLNRLTINPTGNFGSDDYSTYIKFISNGTYSTYNVAPTSNINSYEAGTNVKITYPLDYFGYSINNLASDVFKDEAVVSDVTAVAVINSSYFPDANFRSYLLGQYPKGYITNNDVNSRTSMTILGKSISNLQGIHYFSKLTSLDCSENQLTSLPSSLPSKLESLDCSENQLTSLPSSLPSTLTILRCEDNKISTFENLHLPKNIEVLDCSNNRFTSLDFDDHSGYNPTWHYGTQYLNLRSLNCSNNPYLTEIYYNYDGTSTAALSSLYVSGCSNLTTLVCVNSKLTSISYLPSSLKTLNLTGNLFTSLPTLPSGLETLQLSSNKLTSVSLSNHNNLKILYLGYNPNLTTVTINNNSKLEKVYAYDCPALTTVSCDNNNSLTVMNVDDDTSLKTFNCHDNTAMQKISTYHCTSLTTLNCDNNALTEIGSLSHATSLTKLKCHSNQLTSLDVSSLSNLTELNCYNNKLTSLNVSNKTKLKKIHAHFNQLTSINVQGCSALEELVVECNKLTSLSVQGCNALRLIDCCINKINAAGANTFINSLCTIPAGSKGDISYIYPGYSSSSYVENNVSLTPAQINAARNKRWYPKKYVNGSWVDILADVPGDVNGDGTVTAADITALYDVLLNNDYSQIVNGDQTGDGIITAADVTAVYTILLSSKE